MTRLPWKQRNNKEVIKKKVYICPEKSCVHHDPSQAAFTMTRLPWKQRNNKEVIKKKVYICPEKSCVHHDPSRALGDLTGIKKHFSRKHGDKKWKCDKCSKKYAVQSDRKDSFITHRAFCDALAEESARFITSVPNLNFRNELLSAGNPG
nr:protein indeterminate-domain 9-like [Ipomoea batatas]GMD06652.1 protein indeterminate-domain 9-like [Ipomoea batatas]